MPVIRLNDGYFQYSLTGPSDAPLIIVLHGGRGFGDHRSEFKAFAALADEYRILSFDFRGHGQSSVTPPFTFRQLVEDIEAFRHHFSGSQKVIVAGGSFGGFLAQQYAITYADRISHLVLRGTAPSWHHEEQARNMFLGRLNRAPMASPQMLEKVFSTFKNDEEFRLVMFALAPLYTESFDADAVLAKTLDTVYRAETHNALYSEQEKYFDYRKDLCKVRAKTIIIVGEEDWICPKDQSEVIAQSIPGSELLVIPGANHSVHVEKNDIFIQAIRHFIRSTSRN